MRIENQIRKSPRKIIKGICPTCGKRVEFNIKNCIRCFQVLEK